MKTRFTAGVVFAVFFCFLAVADISAATLVVTKTADTADGVCDADCSLREAIAAAVPDDTILFSPLFNTPQTITLLNGQIAFSKNLTITGPGSNLLTVSGNNANRIFHISGGVTVAMSGMKLINGREANSSDPNGGAISLGDSTLTLTSMIIANNFARYTNPSPPFDTFGNGGAIYSFNSTLTVHNSIINNNTAFVAGGIHSKIGTLHISNCSINNNVGGGIIGIGFENQTYHTLITVTGSTFTGNGRGIEESSGNIVVSNSVFTNNGTGNSAGGSQTVLTIDRSTISNNEPAGGIFTRGASTTIKNSVVNNNHSNGEGGGIRNTGILNIVNSAITNNRSLQSGGGIFNAEDEMYLTNSTVSGNVADDGSGNNPNITGGGICNNDQIFGASAVITNSTISNNRSTGAGGGVRQNSTGAFTFRNTIVAGNLSDNANATDVSGPLVSEGFNLIGSVGASSGWISSDLLNVKPLLAPLGNNGGPTFTHALMPGSPAINAGNNSLAIDPVTQTPLKTDQRGLSRNVGGTVDIGAYESDIASGAVTLSGRVLSPSGRGIFNTRITLTDLSSNILYTQTNSSGYYRFRNLPPGTTFTVNVFHKWFQFATPQIVTVDNNRGDLDFTALP